LIKCQYKNTVQSFKKKDKNNRKSQLKPKKTKASQEFANVNHAHACNGSEVMLQWKVQPNGGR